MVAIAVIGYFSPVSLVWLVRVNSPAADLVGVLPEEIILVVSLVETMSCIIIISFLSEWGVALRLTARSLI